jgi:hypothetical protein
MDHDPTTSDVGVGSADIATKYWMLLVSYHYDLVTQMLVAYRDLATEG